MKQKSFSPNQQPASASPSASASETSQRNTAIVPSPDEIAKRAYFSYVNEGSQPGHEERHWLEAEAQLFAGIERQSQMHPGSSLFKTEH